MEEAGEESDGIPRLEAELTCAICLCLYRDPVLLSCGHSFCKQCIQKMLPAQQQSQAPFTCPMCKQDVGPILQLQRNIQLCNIVEVFQATTPKEKRGEGSEEGVREVLPCDYCLEESQPAVKTCLICDASLCEAHLNKHNAKATHKDHVLVEGRAGSVAEERRCLKHGRLLECYCKNDGQYICLVCSCWGGHWCHNIIGLKEGHAVQLTNLSNTLTQLQERKGALVNALEELQKSEDLLKTSTERLTSDIKNLFDEIKTHYSKKKAWILSAIESNEKKILADITKAKKEMEERRKETERNIQSLQKMREQQDIFLFSKEFKEATDRIASQNWAIDSAKVTVVRTDYWRTERCQAQMKTFMAELDNVLADVHGRLANQITWSSTQPK